MVQCKYGHVLDRSCRSTWPAIWEVGDNWPNGGEIDILEGVNDSGSNKATLHTTGGKRSLD